MAIEGLGTTITRAGFAYKCKSVTPPAITHEDIDITALDDTDFKAYMASILADIGEMTAEVYSTGVYPTSAERAAATTRITWRNAKWIQGNFYIKSYDPGTHNPGEAIVDTMTLRCTGGATALTYG